MRWLRVPSVKVFAYLADERASDGFTTECQNASGQVEEVKNV